MIKISLRDVSNNTDAKGEKLVRSRGKWLFAGHRERFKIEAAGKINGDVTFGFPDPFTLSFAHANASDRVEISNYDAARDEWHQCSAIAGRCCP